jgi:hypothetical protein
VPPKKLTITADAFDSYDEFNTFSLVVIVLPYQQAITNSIDHLQQPSHTLKG